MPKESNIEFPSFEVWAMGKKEQRETFKYLSRGQQQDEYYKEKRDAELLKKKAEKFKADEYNATIRPWLNALDLNITELAFIGLKIIKNTNFDELNAISSMLKNPSHLSQALNEFTEKMSCEFSGEIKNAINKKTDIAFIDYDNPEVSAKLQQLVNTCIDMSKPSIAQKIGCEYSEFSPTSYKSVISKTKKWKN